MFKKKVSSNEEMEEEVIVEHTAVPSTNHVTHSPETGVAPTANDLERLRDILYGPQSRTTDKRLDELETRLESERRELTDLLHERVNSVAGSGNNQITAVRKDLSDRITQIDSQQSSQLRQVEQKLIAQGESQASQQSSQLRNLQRDLTARLDNQESDYTAQLRALQQDMEERFEEMTTTFLTQIRQTYNELSSQLEQLRQEKTEQILALQSETRQRDDHLRHELLNNTGNLDDKKLSRQHMAQLLVEVAQRLTSEG